MIIGKILVLLYKGMVRRSKGLPLCFIGKHQEQLVSAICIGREITSLINGNPLIAHGGMALATHRCDTNEAKRHRHALSGRRTGRGPVCH